MDLGLFGDFGRIQLIRYRISERRKYRKQVKRDERVWEAISVLSTWGMPDPPSDEKQQAIQAYRMLGDYLSARNIYDV